MSFGELLVVVVGGWWWAEILASALLLFLLKFESQIWDIIFKEPFEFWHWPDWIWSRSRSQAGQLTLTLVSLGLKQNEPKILEILWKKNEIDVTKLLGVSYKLALWFVFPDSNFYSSCTEFQFCLKIWMLDAIASQGVVHVSMCVSCFYQTKHLVTLEWIY